MDKYTQLDDRELMNVNGGNWFTDAWKACAIGARRTPMC